MNNELSDLVTRNGEVGAGVEYLGLIVHYAANSGSHCKTDVGVDVDLAYRKLCSLTELLLRNTDRVRKLSADRVDLADVFLRNGGCTVKNDRESGQPLCNLFENVKAERRGNEYAVCVSRALLGLELVCAVACA